MKKAIYPGSFDPITLGHISIIKRGLEVFDNITVVVGNNVKKNYLFSLNDRVDLIKKSVIECLDSRADKINIDVHDGLIIDYARKNDFGTIIRGLRAVSDFEFEIQMANTNRKLAPGIDTVFFMTEEPFLFTSSSVVREIAKFNGDVSCFVSHEVARALQDKFSCDKL